MTNKQIIDGVDVSGCEYLYTDSKYHDKCCSTSIGGNCLCKPSEMLCVKYVEYLKEQINQLKEHYEQQLKAVIDKHNELLKENKTKGAELMQLRRTLIEIKEIAKPFCEECKGFNGLHKERDCMYCNYNKILQKIDI